MGNFFEQVGSLTVTHRSYESILDFCQLTENDIDQLPKNATIIEIGSGEFQEFSQGIKKQRPDVFVVSIDPSLALDSKNKNVFISESGNGKTYHSKSLQSEQPPKTHPLYVCTQLNRVRNAEPGSIAALAPPIPIQSQSADLVVDSHGPSLYLEDEIAINEYIKEISRILKPGGYARIFPVGILTPLFSGNQQEEIKIIETTFRRISQKVKDTASIELFFNPEGTGIGIRKNQESK